MNDPYKQMFADLDKQSKIEREKTFDRLIKKIENSRSFTKDEKWYIIKILNEKMQRKKEIRKYHEYLDWHDRHTSEDSDGAKVFSRCKEKDCDCRKK